MVRTLVLLEGLGLFAAVSVAIVVWADPLLIDWIDVGALLAQAFAVSGCCIVAFYYNDLYDLRIVGNLKEFCARLLQSFGVAFVFLAGFYTFFPQASIAEGAFVSSLVIIVGILLPLRAVAYAIMRLSPFIERVLILGTSPLASRIIEEIEAQPHFRYRVIGVADDAKPGGGPPELYPLLGPLAHLGKIVEELRPDRIVVAMGERRGRMPIRELVAARLHGVVVEDGLEVYERLTGKLAIETLTPSFLIFSPAFTKSQLELGFRRVVALITAAVGMVLTAPLMLFVAALIKLESRGPVFFIQERAGADGKPFRLVKFRTMRHVAGARPNSVWERDDSTRVTRLGHWLRKLRLDELPQFWNILKGEMALVGPRPEMACNVKAMSEHIPYYALRHVVRPGITGWAQVRQGYAVSLEDVTEKVRYDLYYIKHMSLWLDLRILIDTAKIILFGRGAR